MTIAHPHGRIALTGGPIILPNRIASGQAIIVEGSQILGIIAAAKSARSARSPRSSTWAGAVLRQG